jgi:hypothetical protein
MLFLKLVLFVFVTACVLVLVSYGWVVAYFHAYMRPGLKAVGLGAVSAITLRSPSYWLLVVAMLAVAAWLCRRWVFVG